MLSEYEQFLTETPSAARLASIEARLDGDRKAVRPLPPDSFLAAVSLAAFVALAILGAWPFGYSGMHARSTGQMLAEYAAVFISAAALALAVVEQMIPGAKRRVPPALAVLFPVVALLVIVPSLFPFFGAESFVQRGIPCLRLGLICAIPSGGLTWLLMRRGYACGAMSAALCGGAFSGLVGVGALALHCPILNAAHILTWHVGVIAISIAAGALIGALARERG